VVARLADLPERIWRRPLQGHALPAVDVGAAFVATAQRIGGARLSAPRT
jgi:hypothetical protein